MTRRLFSVTVMPFVLIFALLRRKPAVALTPLLARVALIEVIEREMVLEVALGWSSREWQGSGGYQLLGLCSWQASTFVTEHLGAS